MEVKLRQPFCYKSYGIVWRKLFRVIWGKSENKRNKEIGKWLKKLDSVQLNDAQ